ncbi:MAG: hypothetical protein NVS2B17_14240 [Candidatus Velthaea sp.]
MPGRSLSMATAAALVLFSGGALAHAEQPVGGSSAGIAFDEIDRVVPGAADAAPGNFERDVALIGNAGLPVAAPQPKPKRGIMGALGSAGAMLGGLSTVVNAGGSLSTALGIAEFGQQIAPVANILGLTGSANWGGLVQQYMLPQMSPSLVPYVSGYLSAQSAVKSAFGRPATASAPAPDAAALQQYSTGTLKHYAVTSNGWVRIEDASSGRVVINRPDERKSYALDPATKTYSVTDLTHEPDGAAVQPAQRKRCFRRRRSRSARPKSRASTPPATAPMRRSRSAERAARARTRHTDRAASSMLQR